MSSFLPSHVEELLDSLQQNGRELCDEVDRQVPQNKRIMSPEEALDYLAESILFGKIKPANHPKRILQLLQRLTTDELTFDNP